MISNSFKLICLVTFSLVLTSCRAGNPKINSLGSGGFTSSGASATLASSGGVFTDATNSKKVKFTIGYNQMTSQGTAGTNPKYIRGTSAGVANEQ